MTNRERILETLAAAGHPLDDDELARRAGIEPRQTVNQLCRHLASEGSILRAPGPAGKIVNSIAGRNLPTTGGAVAEGPVRGVGPVAGSSVEQRAAEGVMLAALGERLGVRLAPRKLDHPSGGRVELDGADEALTVLVECWAHQGTAKVAQKYKLVNDAVKLHWIATSLPPAHRRLIICVSDEAAVRHLRGRSWQRQAITHLGVELVVVELPTDVVTSITAAQVRQYR